MRKNPFFLALAAIFVIAAPPLFSEQPVDDFLRAFFLIQDGDSAEKRAATADATNHYSAALELLEHVRKHPAGWDPVLIDWRIEYCREHITNNGGGDRILANAKKEIPEPEPVVDSSLKSNSEGFEAVIREKNKYKNQLKQTEAALNQTQAELQRLEQEKAKRLEERSNLESRVRKIAAELDSNKGGDRLRELLAEGDDNKEKLADAQTEVLKTQQHFQQLKDERDALSKESVAMQQRIKATDEELKLIYSTNEARYRTLLNENKLNKEKLETTRSELTRSVAQLEIVEKDKAVRLKELGSLKAMMKQLDQDFNLATNTEGARLKQLLAENGDYKERILRADGNLGQITAQLKVLESEREGHLKELEQLQTALHENRGLKDILNTAEADYRDLSQRGIDALKTELTNTQLKLQDASKDRDLFARERTQLEGRLDVTLKENRGLKDILNQAEVNFRAANDDVLRAVKTELAQARAQLDVLDRENKASIVDRDDLRAQLKLLETTRQTQVAALATDNEALKNQISQAQTELEILKGEKKITLDRYQDIVKINEDLARRLTLSEEELEGAKSDRAAAASMRMQISEGAEQINRLKQEREQLAQSQSELQAIVLKSQTDLENVKGQRLDELETIKVSYAEAKGQITALEKERTLLANKLQDASNEVRDARFAMQEAKGRLSYSDSRVSDIDPMKKELAKAQKHLQAMERERDSLLRNQDALEAKLQKAEQLLGPGKVDRMDGLQAELSKAQNRLQELETQKARSAKEQQELQARLQKLDEVLNKPSEDARTQALLEENAAFKAKLERLQAEIDEAHALAAGMNNLKQDLARKGSGQGPESSEEPSVVNVSDDERVQSLLKDNERYKKRLADIEVSIKDAEINPMELGTLKAQLARAQGEVQTLATENVRRTQERNDMLARLRKSDDDLRSANAANYQKLVNVLKENDAYKQKLAKAEASLSKLQAPAKEPTSEEVTPNGE